MPIGSRTVSSLARCRVVLSRRRAWLATFAACCALLQRAIAAQDAADGPLELRCDARGARMTLGDTALVSFGGEAKVTTHTIPWGSLVTVGRARNQFGDPLRTGSRTLTRRCGRLTLRFEGGFFNANVMGELGALEFPAVTVLVGGRVILPRTGFCDPPASRTLGDPLTSIFFSQSSSCILAYDAMIVIPPHRASIGVLHPSFGKGALMA